jgi:membrane-anchored protein YejM (alkaline phosphatase superfamily)
MRNLFKRAPSTPPATPDAENFLLVTYDSCRYDSYKAAKTPVLSRYASVREAWAHATYTHPSHAGMFQGMLPHVFTEEEYYNRFVRQMWRIQHRKPVDARVVFPRGSKSIIDGFNNLGYFTCGTAAMAWFRNNAELTSDWQSFEWTGIAARRQIEWTKSELSRNASRPFFAFINFGETHSPYKFDGQEGSEGEAEARRGRNIKGLGTGEDAFDEENWRMQIACVEFLDARMGELLEYFRKNNRDVTVVMCGDHGDCFGESGLYGHGFYHPKVMQVPMAIFEFKAGA